MKVSKKGYKKNSEVKNEKSLIVPYGRITMKEDNGEPLEKGPILGIDNLGNMTIMEPGLDYSFPGSYVYEIPMANAKNGGYILPGRYRNPEGNWLNKYAGGGDISIPDLSRPKWLDKYQTRGEVRTSVDPETGVVTNINITDEPPFQWTPLEDQYGIKPSAQKRTDYVPYKDVSGAPYEIQDPYAHNYSTVDVPKNLSELPSYRMYTYGKNQVYSPFSGHISRAKPNAKPINEYGDIDSKDLEDQQLYDQHTYRNFDPKTGYNYELNQENLQPFQSIPMEGDKGFNLRRFVLNPYEGDPQTEDLYIRKDKDGMQLWDGEEKVVKDKENFIPKSYSREETMDNVFKDLYAQNLYKFKGDRDAAYNATSKFMTERVEPQYKGKYYEYINNPNVSERDKLNINLVGSHMTVNPEQTEDYVRQTIADKLAEEHPEYLTNEDLDFDKAIKSDPRYREKLNEYNDVLQDWYVTNKNMSPEEAKALVEKDLYKNVPKRKTTYATFKDGGRLQKFQGDTGPSQVDIVSQQNKYFNEGLDFVRDWMDSPMYNQMVLNSVKGNQAEADYIKKLRKENLETMPSEPNVVFSDRPDKKSVWAHSNADTGLVEVFPKGFNAGPTIYVHEGLHSTDRPRGKFDIESYDTGKNIDYYNKGNIQLGENWYENQEGNVVAYPDWMRVDDPRFPEDPVWSNRVIPQSDVKYITTNRAANWKDNQKYIDDISKYQVPSNLEIRNEVLENNSDITADSPEFAELFKKVKKRYEEEAKDYISGDESRWLKRSHEYIDKPTEVRARLGEIRYDAQQKGIYNPFTEQVTPQIFEKLKNNNRAINDLRSQFTDEEILWMLQNISYNDEVNADAIPTGKYGGRLEKYQSKGQVNFPIADRSQIHNAHSREAGTGVKDNWVDASRIINSYDNGMPNDTSYVYMTPSESFFYSTKVDPQTNKNIMSYQTGPGEFSTPSPALINQKKQRVMDMIGIKKDGGPTKWLDEYQDGNEVSNKLSEDAIRKGYTWSDEFGLMAPEVEVTGELPIGYKMPKPLPSGAITSVMGPIDYAVGLLAGAPALASTLGREILGTGLTAGNILNPLFAAHGAYNFANPESDFRKAVTKYNKGEGDWRSVVGEGGLNALNFLGIRSLPTDAGAMGKFLTTKTPLKNTYKINPWAFKPEEGMMYRGLGEEGFKDAMETGVFRPKQLGYAPNRSFAEKINSPKQFGNTFYAPANRFKVIENYGPEYVAEVPFSGSPFFRRYGRKDWSWSTPREIPIEEGRILQKDWLAGYKSVNTPKQLPGSPNKFKSQINWAKWNPETPRHPELIEEYNAIEESTKKAGTWMKNADGSPYQGSPEQFIQEQSSWFKKAYPEGYDETFRGVGPRNNDPDFSNSGLSEDLVGDRGIFTADRELASSYAPNVKINNKWADKKQILSPLSSKDEPGVFNLIHPKGKQIDFNVMNDFFNEVNLTKAGSSKESILQQLEYKKNHLDRLKKIDADPDIIQHQEKLLKKLEGYANDFENTKTDWDEFEKMKSILGEITSTDDIANYLSSTDLRKITLKNILDGGHGDVTIVNNRPGNYLKSRVGNVGFFNLNDPNIYKALVPAAIAGAGALQKEKDGGGLTKYQKLGEVKQNQTPPANLPWINQQGQFTQVPAAAMKPKSFEARVDEYLGNPMQKGQDLASWAAGPGNDPVDNLRHMKTAEEITTKGGSSLGSAIVANALGAAHELYVLPQTIKSDGLYHGLMSIGEDIINNAVGSLVGATPLSPEAKESLMIYLSDNDMVPDGVSMPKGDMYWKKKNGGESQVEPDGREMAEDLRRIWNLGQPSFTRPSSYNEYRPKFGWSRGSMTPEERAYEQEYLRQKYFPMPGSQKDFYGLQVINDLSNLLFGKQKKSGGESQGEGYYDYLRHKGSNAYSIFAKGGAKGWLDNYK